MFQVEAADVSKGGKGKAPGKGALEAPRTTSPDIGAPPAARIFPAALNDAWHQCLASLQQLLEPLMPVIRKSLPEVPSAAGGDAADLLSTTTKPAGGKKGAEDDARYAAAASPKLLAGGHRLLLLVDPELRALPFEALPYLRVNCSSVARCPSMHMLHVASKGRAGQAAEAPSVPPTFELGGMTYIVDPKCEGSSPEDARGPFSPPLIPTFKSTLLNDFKDWKGLMGSPNRTPADAELMQLVSSSSGLVFLGMGRFMSYVTPGIVSSVDLRGCELAVLLGNVNNAKAHQRQLYLDNRKSVSERSLESPMRAAELLLARGVKTVVVVTMATTAQTNCDMLRSIFSALQGGATVAEAVWSTLKGCVFDLDHVHSGVVVMGLPHMVAGGGGGKGGKGGK